eukprot:gene22018-24963_t
MFFEPIESGLNSESSSFKRNDVEEPVWHDVGDESLPLELSTADAAEVKIDQAVVDVESVVKPTETNKEEQHSLNTDGTVDTPSPALDSPTDNAQAALEEKYMKAVVELAGASETVAPETDAAPAAPEENKFDEYMTKATDAKAAATEAFKAKEYNTAKLNYMTALETLQYVQGDLDNKQKSMLFEQTVACNNNVALCCMSTEDYVNCVAFATNSLLLIRSLEKNIPDSMIWMCLQGNGVTMEQLQRQWKRKALYYIGKAQLKRKNYQEAVVHLEEAYNLIADDASLAKQVAELKALVTDAKARLNKENKREKDTWAKAFKKGKTEVESIYHDPRDTPTSSAPTTPVHSSTPLDPNNLKFDLSDLG